MMRPIFDREHAPLVPKWQQFIEMIADVCIAFI